MSPKTRLKLHDAVIFVLPKPVLRRMRTCRQIAEEVAYPRDRNMLQKIDLKFHLLICNSCHVLAKDFNFISEVVHEIATEVPSEADDDFTERMAKRFGNADASDSS